MDLTRVHQANLAILKEIDRICREEGIQYMLDAGTLIGAVRHKGFIPWDDDADVAFTRDNYTKFIRAAKKKLPAGMTLLEPKDLRNGTAFYDFTARICYDNSSTHEDSGEMQFYEGKLNHLWVDLFTIDELPENKISAAFTKLLHKGIYGLAMGHRYHLDFSKYSLANKIFVGGLCCSGKTDSHEMDPPDAVLRGSQRQKRRQQFVLLQQLSAGLPVCDSEKRVVQPDGGYGI